MKKLFIIICVLVTGSTAAVVAQSNAHAIPYQAVARDASGNLLANQTISLRFSLITGSPSGSLYYQETQTATTNSLGLFSTHIFQAVSNTTTGAFDPTKWKIIAALGAFIKVEMDPSGGSTYTDMGTTQMMSVPFALYSEMSGTSEGALVYISGWNALTNSPPLVSSVGTKGYYYVVSVAGPTSLDGISNWSTGDWAIFNGTVWQKVDNTDAVSDASSVAFTPNADITATNVQDAIVEVRDDTDAKLSAKQNSLGYTAEDISNKVTSISGTSTNTQYPGAKLVFDQLALKEPTITGTGNTTDYWSGAKTFATLNKAAVGLGNVDNTSDLNKPVSTAQAAADAVVLSVANSKINRSGDTMTGTLILNADPTTGLGAATKQYVDATDALKLNLSGGTLTGNLILNADPTTALGASTKQYVDTKVSLAGGTMTGDLVLNAAPTTPLGAATKQYVDDASSALGVALKADKVVGATLDNIAILSATGNLVDGGKKLSDYLDINNSTSYTPTGNYNPATKKYVDDADALKADKVVGATAGHIATYSALGNLMDGGAKTGSNISFVPTPVLVSTNIQDAIEEVNSQFADLIDSYISRTDDGVYIYKPTPATIRFGVGVTQPVYRLGVKAEGTNENLISFHDASNAPVWGLSFVPSTSGPHGFSIDDISTGTAVSRLHISSPGGNMSVGKITDRYLLGLREYDPLKISFGITNTADSAINSGWSLSHIHDSSTPERSGAFSIFEEGLVAAATVERITILPTITTPTNNYRNVGINETLPYATLHVSRSASDPGTAIDTALGTGIVMVGETVGHNLVLDYQGIQAREYNPLKQYIIGDTQLYLQSLGGGIVIHSNSSIPSDKAIITHDAKLGLGTITPAEKIDIDGAIKIGTSLNSGDGTIRYTGTDFEGRKGGAWVSLTQGSVANGIWQQPGGTNTDLIYFAPAVAHPKVGINEPNPDVTLQVTRPVGDPDANIDLASGKGITVFGPIIGQNLGFDSHQIQARTGAYVGGTTTIGFTATALNIQPVGGDVLFHSSSAIVNQVIVTSNGLVGLGKTPVERLDVNGAVTFGDTQTAVPAEGTVRWHNPGPGTPSDLEVFKSGVWKSLTTQTVTDGFANVGTDMIAYNPANPKVGIGTVTPDAALHVNGRIIVGNSVDPGTTGSIRWSGSDFEGYDGSNWKSFTLSNWAGTLTLSGVPAITYNTSSPKVGIGVANPSATLDIHESSSVTGSSTAMILSNSGSTSSSNDTRLGLNISCTGSWSSNASAKNIGLYISNVSGQSNSNANLAAVLNGNTVIGDVTGSTIVGTGGTNVLAIQTGTVPVSAPGTTTVGGIQIYSDDVSTGAGTPPSSVVHIMNGDGTVIKLFKQSAITAIDTNIPNSGDPTTDAIISNTRQRVLDLENALKNLGLLQ